ncbi:hypothetical protein Tco_0289835 [Tanacetum coccineum]
MLVAPTWGVTEVADSLFLKSPRNNFEIKHGLLNLVQYKLFLGMIKKTHMITSVISTRYFLRLKFPNHHVVLRLGCFNDLLWDASSWFQNCIKLDTFYNALNSNESRFIELSCSGDNFLDKMPRGIALPPKRLSDVAEIKDMVRAFISIEDPNNCFRTRLKAVDQCCVRVGEVILIKIFQPDYSNKYHDNFLRVCVQAASGQFQSSFILVIVPSMVSIKIRPPGFPPVRFIMAYIAKHFNRGNNILSKQRNNFNKANDAGVDKMQNQGQTCNSQMQNLMICFQKFVNANTASTYGSGTLPGNNLQPKEDLKAEFAIGASPRAKKKTSTSTYTYASMTMNEAQIITLYRKELLAVGVAFEKFRFNILVMSKSIVDFEIPHQDKLRYKEINEAFPIETLGSIALQDQSTPWFADFANYHAGFRDKTLNSIGHTIYKDTMTLSHVVTICQQSGKITQSDEMHKFHQFATSLTYGALILWGRFRLKERNLCTTVAVDYLSKWVDAKATHTIDARVVCKFLKNSLLSIGAPRERISKKRTKNEAKTTKPDTEWKSVEKTQSSPSPSVKKSTQVNPDKPEAKKSRKTSLGTKLVKSLNLFKEEKEEKK